MVMLSVILLSVVVNVTFIIAQYHGECQFFSLQCLIMLSVIMLGVVLLNVVILSVAAP
jgi:hypothetical protein